MSLAIGVEMIVGFIMKGDEEERNEAMYKRDI